MVVVMYPPLIDPSRRARDNPFFFPRVELSLAATVLIALVTARILFLTGPVLLDGILPLPLIDNPPATSVVPLLGVV